MPGDLILAIDAGTQSIRAAFVDAAGEIVGFHQIHIEPFVSPQPGWAEQDPEYLWGALCDAVTGLTAAHPALTGRIAAVTLAVQRQVHRMQCLRARRRHPIHHPRAGAPSPPPCVQPILRKCWVDLC